MHIPGQSQPTGAAALLVHQIAKLEDGQPDETILPREAIVLDADVQLVAVWFGFVSEDTLKTKQEQTNNEKDYKYRQTKLRIHIRGVYLHVILWVWLQFASPRLIFFVLLYPTVNRVASLHAGPVGCISYNMYTVKGLCSFFKGRCPTEHLIYARELNVRVQLQCKLIVVVKNIWLCLVGLGSFAG